MGCSLEILSILMIVLRLYVVLQNKKISGIFNIGTGINTAFIDLANLIFKNLEIEPKSNLL